ncbi:MULTISPECIES: DUF6389 family protein [Streptomyces]|uniref:DUF6389 family protein n=1 Tax=Streptomyces TaxID=1883 RepID=UPI002064FD41|nr:MULTISPECIES: DUF6389 family protein [Streptomyces]UPT39971.1 DUF6389 family protein [Streptomyces sp. WAC00303]WIY74263.1 DUF6389 family protein [Streptomyces anulatus]
MQALPSGGRSLDSPRRLSWDDGTRWTPGPLSCRAQAGARHNLAFGGPSTRSDPRHRDGTYGRGDHRRFPDQEGHGTFAVWARFSGADSFALDRQIGDERELFKVVWTDNGLEPAVPQPPSSWSTLHLEDVLFDTVAEWLDLLIPPDATDLQWEVTTPDGTQDHRQVGPSR